MSPPVTQQTNNHHHHKNPSAVTVVWFVSLIGLKEGRERGESRVCSDWRTEEGGG